MPAGTDGPGRREAGTCRVQGTTYPDDYLCMYYYIDVSYDPVKAPTYLVEAVNWSRKNMRAAFLAEHRYVAVILFNLPDHQGEDAFGVAHKDGAVFAVDDLLNSKLSATDLVANTTVCKKSFLYQHGKRQWLVIEEHQARRSKTGQSGEVTDHE